MRQDHDKKEMDKLFTVMDVNVSANEDMEFCRRIGEKGQQARPLVVGFYTEWSRSVVLKNTKYLADSDHSHISIVPDLTQQQRKAERSLQAEAERRNEEELSNDDISKNLSWRVVGKRGQKRLIKSYNMQQEQQIGANSRAGRGGGGLLRPRARGRGWIPMTGQRKRGHPDQEQDQADTIERPPKRGNRGRGRPPGRIATGANRVPLSLSQPQAQQEVSIRMGAEEEEVESQETDMDQLSQDQVVVEEEEEEGLRLGEL